MSKLKIGWASRDVSTTKPVDIPGQFHIRVSTGIIDPITVTALVLESGGDIAVFLSGDFVSIRPYLVTETRDEIAKRLPGFPVEKIVICCTHTHAGASYYKSSSSMSTPDEIPHPGIEIADGNEYRAFLVGKIADAIEEAYAGRAPGGIAYGYGYAVAGHSRRVVYFDDLSKRPGSSAQASRVRACRTSRRVSRSRRDHAASSPAPSSMVAARTQRVSPTVAAIAAGATGGPAGR